jgi:hypothetical protein
VQGAPETRAVELQVRDLTYVAGITHVEHPQHLAL